MSKSELYQKSKKLIDYFNEKKINVRTLKPIKGEKINALQKKFVSKGSTIEFWKRRSQTLENKKKVVEERVLGQEKLNGKFVVEIMFDISDQKDIKRLHEFSVSTPTTIDDIFKDGEARAREKWEAVVGHNTFKGDIRVSKVSVVGPNRPIRQMPINDVKFFKINNIGSANDAKIKDNCVKYALEKFYGKAKYYTKKARKAIENTEQHTVESLVEFMKEYKLDFRFFHNNGKIYDQNITNGNKVIHGYLANEHFYLMDGKDCSFLNQNKVSTIKNVKNCMNVQELVEKTLEEGEEIKHFKIKYYTEAKTYQFTDCVLEDDIKYTNNETLVKAYNMYNKILEDDKEIYNFLFDENFKIYTPLMKIAECNNLKSTFTNFMNTPKPLFYNTKQEGDFCIDKNKAYSWSLCNLKNLPVINASTQEEPFDGVVNNEYFYFVDNVYNNEYGRNVFGWCSGYRIGNLKNIKITKQIKPKLIKNPFTGLINKMAEYDVQTTKTICNIFFGICQTKKGNNLVPSKIIKTTHGYDNDDLVKCGKYYVVLKEVLQKTKFTEDMKPIAHFIVDYMVSEMFNKINQLPIDKIVKLKTDSITYIGSPPNIKLDKNDFNGWKEERVKKDDFIVKDRPVSQKQIIEVGKKINIHQNVLFNCSAGSGKTYCAINELIPKLKGKTIVISATCKALEEYYELNNENIDEY